MIDFDMQQVLINARNAETQDLLNRVTVYRAGMEQQALPILEKELYDRGVTAANIQEYRERLEKAAIFLKDGIAAKCSFCREPAVTQGWGWQRLWGKLPLFPRHFYYCKEHRPKVKQGQAVGELKD